jgi:hypothetical protein
MTHYAPWLRLRLRFLEVLTWINAECGNHKQNIGRLRDCNSVLETDSSLHVQGMRSPGQVSLE